MEQLSAREECNITGWSNQGTPPEPEPPDMSMSIILQLVVLLVFYSVKSRGRSIIDIFILKIKIREHVPATRSFEMVIVDWLITPGNAHN